MSTDRATGKWRFCDVLRGTNPPESNSEGADVKPLNSISLKMNPLIRGQVGCKIKNPVVSKAFFSPH
jgi:hypothetical protein